LNSIEFGQRDTSKEVGSKRSTDIAEADELLCHRVVDFVENTEFIGGVWFKSMCLR
jgi:hypothetical protein